jgi:DNA processing protein
MTRIADVERAVTAVCASGTDPRALATILTWACGPRRSLDALRRRVRDDAADPSRRSLEAAAGEVAAVARADGGLDGPLATVALRVIDIWVRLGVQVALVGDTGYPALLAEGWPTIDAPVLLAWRGRSPAAVGPGVAIVGARNASAYGRSVAELLASAVARAGGRVVSGGAVGIDAAAHVAALGQPGGTTVVLGCGHAVPYPSGHARRGGLFERVLAGGGTLVSELLPEVPAHAGVIRARNRVLAGLAAITVVVEGGHRSGALLTAGAAAERGREVFAVPGDILAPGSVAPLRLLAEGARVCAGPEDLLALLPLPQGDPKALAHGHGHAAVSAAAVLPDEVHRLLAQAGPRGVAIEELALAHVGPLGSLLAALARARLAGAVEDIPGGIRLRPSRPSVA